MCAWCAAHGSHGSSYADRPCGTTRARTASAAARRTAQALPKLGGPAEPRSRQPSAAASLPSSPFRWRAAAPRAPAAAAQPAATATATARRTARPPVRAAACEARRRHARTWPERRCTSPRGGPSVWLLCGVHGGWARGTLHARRAEGCYRAGQQAGCSWAPVGARQPRVGCEGHGFSPCPVARARGPCEVRLRRALPLGSYAGDLRGTRAQHTAKPHDRQTGPRAPCASCRGARRTPLSHAAAPPMIMMMIMINPNDDTDPPVSRCRPAHLLVMLHSPVQDIEHLPRSATRDTDGQSKPFPNVQAIGSAQGCVVGRRHTRLRPTHVLGALLPELQHVDFLAKESAWVTRKRVGVVCVEESGRAVSCAQPTASGMNGTAARWVPLCGSRSVVVRIIAGRLLDDG
jgi:hypothetical protein